MKNALIIAWVLFYAVATFIILTPFVAIGFACGFCWWGIQAGAAGAERCLNEMPSNLAMRRDEIKGMKDSRLQGIGRPK
jgi:hypothetical protein